MSRDWVESIERSTKGFAAVCGTFEYGISSSWRQYICAEACKPILPARKFDVVLSSQVFEHEENLTFTLGEIRHVLKPGGTAILSFPFLYNGA